VSRRREKRAYIDTLQQELGELVESLELDPMRKRYLRSRWLDQVAWMEGRAESARRLYYVLRLVTVVGAVVVPALVSLTALDTDLETPAQVATWVISLAVGISAAVEGFFRFGERWRTYRRTVERLKAEGWLFLQLSGPYARATDGHAGAYPAFARRVEATVLGNVDSYITEVASEREKGDAPTRG
jgi:hypothetical protein